LEIVNNEGGPNAKTNIYRHYRNVLKKVLDVELRAPWKPPDYIRGVEAKKTMARADMIKVQDRF
jgi:hypothetical protein